MHTLLANQFFLTLLLLCLPLVANGQDTAFDVHGKTRDRPAKERYEYLLRWVLPSEDRSGFRLALDFTPVNPAPPFRVLGPADVSRLENAKTNGETRVQVGGRLVSAAMDLIEAARELDRLNELHGRIKSAPATDEKQQRQQNALLALVEMATGDVGAASERVRKLSDQYDQELATGSDLRYAETLVCMQGLGHPELYDEILILSSSMMEREALPGVGRSSRDAWNHQIAALVGTIEHLSSQKEGKNAARDRSNWLPVSRVTARTRGQGLPLAQWNGTHDSVTNYAGHEDDYLYYRIPLRGNFEVECDITGRGWQDIHLLVAGFWVAPSYDFKSYHVGNARQYLSNTPLSPTLSPFDDWVRYRVAVRDGVCTTWCNGRLIHRQTLESEHDPWLAVRCPWYAVGAVRSLRITGTPEIPRRIAIAAPTDLSGWKSYYDRPVAGGAPWAPASALRGVFGRLQSELPDDSAESLLYYHRPLLEDGTIEYEFFYREGETLVHPAVDRLVFLMEPHGVRIHWATDANFDRTSADPQNVTDEPKNRRGPDSLPLKKDAWNRLHLKLSGDTVDLVLNDQLIYERELEPDNQRLFGFFHYADQTEARVQNVTWRGDWPRTLPAITEQELAGAATDEVERELAGLKASVRHNFSDDGLPRERFDVLGDDDNSRVVAKADGLHVDHPGSSSSVAAQIRVHGNFEITASFENFRFTPSDNGSCGISLTAILENDGYTHGTVHRGALIEDQKPNRQFAQAEFVRTRDDKPQQTWHGTTSEEATSGRLRLARVGETLYCLFAENDSPHFRLIHSEQVGSESLLFGGIRLTTAMQSKGKTPGTMSVIWKDLTIRAERITDWPFADRADETDSSGSGEAGDGLMVIATVFGKPLYLNGVEPLAGAVEAKRRELAAPAFEEWFRAYRGRRTYQNVWSLVQQEYIQREALEVTKEELAEIIKSVERHVEADLNPPIDETFTPEQRKGIMVAWQRASFLDWKVCRSLYKKYEGRVGFGSLGAWVAFDGQNALLREHHQSADIKFLVSEIEEGFWQHTKIKNFADAYPTGERLKELLATPPHLSSQSSVERKTSSLELFGGKTLDQWITQAKQGRVLEDRHQALQVLRNLGLSRDRDKTIRAFTELLDSDVPTVQSLAAAGLKKAGRPTHPDATARLAEILSRDLSHLKLPQGGGEVGAEFGLPMRAMSALGAIGEKTHLPVLKRIAGNENVNSLFRRAALTAIDQIDARFAYEKSTTAD